MRTGDGLVEPRVQIAGGQLDDLRAGSGHVHRHLGHGADPVDAAGRGLVAQVQGVHRRHVVGRLERHVVAAVGAHLVQRARALSLPDALTLPALAALSALQGQNRILEVRRPGAGRWLAGWLAGWLARGASCTPL